MAKFIGDINVTLRYTIRDVEVETADEDSAEAALKSVGENYDSDEILNCGDWDYDVELEEVSELGVPSE